MSVAIMYRYIFCKYIDMNKKLIYLSLLTGTLILSSVIFVAFFWNSSNITARAFVVVSPMTTLGATSLGAMTSTAAELARTSTFHSYFINDLTISGTTFTDNILERTYVSQITPGLISVDVYGEGSTIPAIATSGAYSIIRVIEEYYTTSDLYRFSVIDGSLLAATASISPFLGVLLSIGIGTLTTLLIFLIVFSTRKPHALRKHSHKILHASHANIDLKLPENFYKEISANKETPKNEKAHAYDYMRDVYAEYDASLEEVLSQESDSSIKDDRQETEVVTKPTEHKNKPKNISNNTKTIDSTDKSSLITKAAKQAKNYHERISGTLAKDRIQNAVETLGNILTKNASSDKNIKESQEKSIDSKSVTKKKNTKGSIEKVPANLPVAQEGHVRTAQRPAPKNLPTGEDIEQNNQNISKSQIQSIPENELDDPTPEELRKRLNDLLSGKPPKISS